MSDVDLPALQHELLDAINAGGQARARHIGLQLAAHADDDPPTFHVALNALGYHNQLSLLNEIMAAAWPRLRQAPGYSRPAVEAYAARATDHLIYAFLSASPGATASTDAMFVRLEAYFPIEPSRLQAYLALLSGDKGRPWTMEDFTPLQMPALSGLVIEFMGYGRHAGVPYSRAHLVRELMPRYLLDRQAGNLQPKMDMVAALRRDQHPFPEGRPATIHPLVPDHPSFLLFLQRLLQTAYPQTHAAAALLTLTPAWLDFLLFRDLISETTAEGANAFLPELRRALRPLLHDHPDQTIRALVQ